MRNTSAPGGSDVRRIFTCLVVVALGDLLSASRPASVGAGVAGVDVPVAPGAGVVGADAVGCDVVGGDVVGGDVVGAGADGGGTVGCEASAEGAGVVDDSVATAVVPGSRARSTPA